MQKMFITQLVLKVASQCNLNCSYCYMYNMGDSSYRSQPKFMSNDTIQATLFRVKQHCIENDLDSFNFVLHGGEPLLLGIEYFKNLIEEAYRILSPIVHPTFSLQTNGVLATDEWGHFFKEYGIQVGISIDGTKKNHDRFRTDHANQGSYDRAVAGLRILQRYIQPGIMAVINCSVDVKEFYSSLKNENIQSLDILLPEANYEKPPFQDLSYFNLESTPFGDWLTELYILWKKDKHRPHIGFLHQIISLVFGNAQKGNEGLGVNDNAVLVIETDGSIEAVDSLKICGEGFTKTNLNISRNYFEEALNTELGNQYYNSHSLLSQKCQSCPINMVCGGGMLAHRYSALNNFDNPSIYCKDLIKIITYIQNDIIESFQAEVTLSGNVEKLTFRKVRSSVETC